MTDSDQPIPPVSADSASQTERTVLALRELLLRGEFPCGHRLTELALAARLNASRTPVRQALGRLAHEGLLEPLPNGGFVVREFTLQDIWDAIEIRGTLEGIAARMAAQRVRDSAELDNLRHHCEELEKLSVTGPTDFVLYMEANERFHEELWRLAKSPMLARSIYAAIALPFAAPNSLVFSAAEQKLTARISVIAAEHHRGILEAIEDRDMARAEAIAREHSRVSRKNLMRAIQDKELLSRMPGAALIRLPEDAATPSGV